MSIFAQYLAVVMLYEAERLDEEVYSGSFEGLSHRLSKQLQGISVAPGEVAEALGILTEFGGAKYYDNPLTNGYWQVNYDNFRYYFIESSPDANETDREEYVEIRDSSRKNYPILVTYADNGAQFAEDVIRHLSETPEDSWSHLREDVQAGMAAPASDRVVTLQHNQQAEIETVATELIEAVEKSNSIEGETTMRQRIVGQLKAARELVRGQTLNAYLLYITTMGVLNHLIEKYGGQAIGETAKKLLDLLIENVFKS